MRLGAQALGIASLLGKIRQRPVRFTRTLLEFGYFYRLLLHACMMMMMMMMMDPGAHYCFAAGFPSQVEFSSVMLLMTTVPLPIIQLLAISNP